MALVSDIQLQDGSVKPPKLDTTQKFTVAGLTATTALAVGETVPLSTTGLVTVKSANDITNWIQTTNTNGNVSLYLSNDARPDWALKVAGTASDSFIIANSYGANNTEQYPAFSIGTAGAVGVGKTGAGNIIDVAYANSTTGGIQLTETTNSVGVKLIGESTSGSIGTTTNHKMGFRVNGATQAAIDTSGQLGIGTDSPGAKLDVRGSATFNEGGAAVDFRVEGDTEANLLFVDGSADRVGIGTATPASLLHVDDGVGSNTVACFNGTINASCYAGEKEGHIIQCNFNNFTQRGGLSFNIDDVGTVTDCAGCDSTVVTINGANTCVCFFKCDGSNDDISLVGGSIGNALCNDTSPTLGGNLDVNNQCIINSNTDEGIRLVPNGAGRVIIDGLCWPATDGTAGYVLCTNGSGDLTWSPDGGSTWDVGSGVLFTNAGCKVGIGTSTPSGTLTVFSCDSTTAWGLNVCDPHLTCAYGAQIKVTGACTGFPALNVAQNSDTLFRVDTGGNVGIGTASPSEKLHVHGGVTIQGSGDLCVGSPHFKITSDGVATWGDNVDNGVLTWDSGKAVVGGQSSHALQLNANGSHAATINTGFFGIGTTSNIGFGGSCQQVIINGDANARLEFGIGGSQLGGLYADTNQLVLYTSGNDYLSLQTCGVERIRILSTGNVGIGTTAPSETLSVVGDAVFDGPTQTISSAGVGRVGAAINLDSNYQFEGGYIANGTTSGSDYLGAVYFNTVDTSGNGAGVGAAIRSMVLDPYGRYSLDFHTTGNNATEGDDALRMRISSNGNVGIGTTTPNYALTIFGSSTTIQGLNICNDGGGNGGRAVFGVTGCGYGAYGVGPHETWILPEVGCALTLGSALIDVPIKFIVCGSEKARFTSSGLGIGTTNPLNMLHVESSFAGTLVKIKNTRGNAGCDTALEVESSTTAAKTLLVKNAATDRFWVQGDGTSYFNGVVGIGTTSPSRLLHLSSTGGTFARFTSENTDDFSVGANANGFVVYNETDADYPFVITNTGNVGIGTTSPSYMLDVYQAAGGTANYLQVGSVSHGHALLGVDASGARLQQLGLVGGCMYFQMICGTAMVIDCTMNVGIGTSSPAGQLAIMGDASSTQWALNVCDLNATCSYGARVFGKGSAAGYPLFLVEQSGSELFRVDTGAVTTKLNSGGLGIGTTVPRYNLNVYGNSATAIGIGIDNTSGNATLDISALGGTYNAHGAAACEVWFYSPDNINIGGATSNTNDIKFLGGGSEIARFQTGGRVGIGTTAACTQVQVHATGNIGNEGYMVSKGGFYVGLHPNTANESYHIFCASIGGGSSTLYIGNASINVTSDCRAKENIIDFTDSALGLLCQARVVKFNYIPECIHDESCYGPSSRGEYVGLIAQETKCWARWSVNDGDGNPDGDHLWKAEYEHLVPLLIKATQELQEEVTTLKSKVAALEAA